MPGYVIPSPKFTGWSDLGVPLAGGLLYSYQAGTVVPATTYSDVALAVPNANPVVLDAAGRATVFIPDASVGSFKFVLKTAAGVQIWSQDNVSIPAVPAANPVGNIPAGGIVAYGGTTAPSGFLLCDGASYLQATYPALFLIISTTFGSGTGSDTFNVPNLKQRFPLGLTTTGTGSALGQTGGEIDHTHTGPNHSHDLAPHNHTMSHTHNVEILGYGSALVGGGGTLGKLNASDGVTGNPTEAQNVVQTSGTLAPDTGHTGTLTTTFSGTGNTSAKNPPYLTVNFLIKT